MTRRDRTGLLAFAFKGQAAIAKGDIDFGGSVGEVSELGRSGQDRQLKDLIS